MTTKILLQGFCDIESGKNSERPEMNKALELAKANDAILIVAKLDRLSSSMTFIVNLMEDKTEIPCGYNAKSRWISAAHLRSFSAART